MDKIDGFNRLVSINYVLFNVILAAFRKATFPARPLALDANEFLRPFFPPLFLSVRVAVSSRHSSFRPNRSRRFGCFNSFRLPIFSRRKRRRLLRFGRRRGVAFARRASASSSRFVPVDRSRRQFRVAVVRPRRIDVASNRTTRIS